MNNCGDFYVYISVWSILENTAKYLNTRKPEKYIMIHDLVSLMLRKKNSITSILPGSSFADQFLSGVTSFAENSCRPLSKLNYSSLVSEHFVWDSLLRLSLSKFAKGFFYPAVKHIFDLPRNNCVISIRLKLKRKCSSKYLDTNAFWKSKRKVS